MFFSSGTTSSAVTYSFGDFFRATCHFCRTWHAYQFNNNSEKCAGVSRRQRQTIKSSPLFFNNKRDDSVASATGPLRVSWVQDSRRKKFTDKAAPTSKQSVHRNERRDRIHSQRSWWIECWRRLPSWRVRARATTTTSSTDYTTATPCCSWWSSPSSSVPTSTSARRSTAGLLHTSPTTISATPTGFVRVVKLTCTFSRCNSNVVIWELL